MPLRFNILLITAAGLGLPTLAFGQFSELADKVPPGANAIVAIDAAAVGSAPLAQQEGWTKKLEQAFVDRAVFLPPEADKLIIASHLAHDDDFRQDWEVSVMSLSEPFSLRSIARAEGGYVDEINGTQVVWSPSNAYLVGLDDQQLGIIYPAMRQKVSRWLDEIGQSGGGGLSPYLQSALGSVTSDTQIVMAIDLKDAASPHRVEDGLKSSEALKKSSLKLEDVVALVQTIQGARIEVSIGEKAQFNARIDFGQPVNMTGAIAKQLVLEALDRLGLHLPNLADQRFSTAGKSITVEGDLSSHGLRRLFSLLEIPTTKFSELEDEVAEGSTPSAGDMAENSQTYFKSVVSLLDDLRGDRQKQDTRGGMDGVWMERYARKIDRLPILYVDEDLLEFGSKTAQTLRVMSGARRGAGLSAGTAKSALRTTNGAWSGGYSDYSYGYGGAGYAQVDGASSNAKDRAQIDRSAQNQATSTKVEGWNLIEAATADIRREMTSRYGVEF